MKWVRSPQRRTPQVAAERLGLTIERVSFVYGDSSLPGTDIAGGSQQMASIGASVIAAIARWWRHS